jgi:aspartate/methionine/tyrosine aminotransferase
VIADELYARQIFDGREFTHLRALGAMEPENLVTILGPSKTESLSGFRLGAAFGSPSMIERMEKLQAIVSLRCAGYCQAAFRHWFDEPEGWMEARVAAHQAIRDDLCARIDRAPGMSARKTDGGSYLFAQMPELDIGLGEFVRALRQLAAVSVTPGTEFGPQFTRHFRVNFSQDHRAAVAALERTIEIVERYRKR